jgi:hypothetical protein
LQIYIRTRRFQRAKKASRNGTRTTDDVDPIWATARTRTELSVYSEQWDLWPGAGVSGFVAVSVQLCNWTVECGVWKDGDGDGDELDLVVALRRNANAVFVSKP